MRPATGLVFLFCLGAAAIIAPVSGAAKAPKPPKSAQFKVTVKGNQVTTWSYHKAQKPPCEGAADGGGSVQMSFQTRAPGKVTAYEIKKGNPLYSTTNGRPYIGPPMQLSATADMEGDYAGAQPPQPEQCEDNGGGVVPQPQDCGLVVGFVDLSLSYVNRNRLLVRGDSRGWGQTAVSTGTGDELRSVFSNCPYWVTGPYDHSTAEGELDALDQPLKERALFDPSKKKLSSTAVRPTAGRRTGWRSATRRRVTSRARSSPPGS